MTEQLLLTPDHLRGRLSGVVGLVTGVAAALGPVLGGVLMEALPGNRAVLACTAGIAAVTVLVTASPTLRAFPRTSPASPEGETTMDDNARYEVLRNDEDQYSLWLAGHEVPAGWHRVGKEGTKEECSAYVDEVWTDMRPRSLREFMDGAAQS
jgi:MbtH protein